MHSENAVIAGFLRVLYIFHVYLRIVAFFEFCAAGNISGSENCVEPRAFQYRYKKILAKCRVKDHNFHQLRHTLATNCMQQGFDAKTLSIILGHKNVNITLNRYIHPDRVHERRLMNSISALF